MKIQLTIILFCLSLFSFGQEEVQEESLRAKNAIIFTPINIIDPVNPTFQMGLQRQLNEKWESQIEIGFLLKKSPWDKLFEDEFDFEDSMKVSHKGFRLRMELKYYLNDNKWARNYVSLESFYLKNDTRTSEYFLGNGGKLYSDFFQNKKTNMV